MNLRDHDHACVHERNWAYKEEFKGWMCGDIECPGGRVPTRTELIDILGSVWSDLDMRFALVKYEPTLGEDS